MILQFGERIEDTVLVNRGMSTSLTKSEKDYVVVDQGDYVAQTSDGKIISYRADAFEETFELAND